MARWSKCGARPVLSTVCGYGQSSGERPLLMWTATSWALIMLRNIISADSGNAHRIGVDLDNLDRATLPTASVTVSGTGSGSDSPQAQAQAQAQPQPQPPAQARIDDVLTNQATEAYIKLLKTAYLLALDGLPLSTFKTLVSVQKANGVCRSSQVGTSTNF